jgi:hypothetical protein
MPRKSNVMVRRAKAELNIGMQKEIEAGRIITKQTRHAIRHDLYAGTHFFAPQPGPPYRRFPAMIFPSLTEAERAALEDMAVHGPSRTVAVPIRGRLALYRMIDETPQGWAVTALGREALQAVPPVADSMPDQKTASSRSAGSGRHYGKKTRDTSWFG